MGGVLIELSPRPLAGVLSPLLVRQGARVRRTIPILPEAAGPRVGVEGAVGSRDQMRLLVLGESTAAGVGVADQKQAIGRQLALALQRQRGGAVHWRVVAATGMTAKRLVRECVPEAVGVPFDVAVVMLGVNDTLRLRSGRAWAASLAELVAALTASRPAARVILSGVPDVGGFRVLPQPLRAVMGMQARGLNHRLRGLVRTLPGVELVPAPDLPADRISLAADNFHPGAAGYVVWASHLARHIGTDPSTGR